MALEDHEQDALFDEGIEAALQAWGIPGKLVHPPCPYPEGSEEAEVWWRGFWNQYNRDNH